MQRRGIHYGVVHGPQVSRVGAVRMLRLQVVKAGREVPQLELSTSQAGQGGGMGRERVGIVKWDYPRLGGLGTGGGGRGLGDQQDWLLGEKREKCVDCGLKTLLPRDLNCGDGLLVRLFGRKQGQKIRTGKR